MFYKIGAVVQIEHNNAYADYWYAIDTGQLADTPTWGLPTRGMDISWTGELANWTTRSLVDATGSSTCCFN